MGRRDENVVEGRDADRAVPEEVEAASDLDRREFVRRAVVAATAGTLGLTSRTEAVVQTAPSPVQATATPAILPLGNGEPPALQFQPYPGGTGALLEKLARARGRDAFDRATFTVQRWSGVVPDSDEDIAFLPAHRLSALVKERRVTSARLTDIYLDRLTRLNATLNCAVTIMADQARAEARRADAEIKAGRYRGPLHGIPLGLQGVFLTKRVPTPWGGCGL